MRIRIRIMRNAPLSVISSVMAIIVEAKVRTRKINKGKTRKERKKKKKSDPSFEFVRSFVRYRSARVVRSLR